LHQLTPSFQQWSQETFRFLVGLFPKDADRLIDWGNDTGRPVVIVQTPIQEFISPQIKMKDHVPYLIFSPKEQPSIRQEDNRLFFDFDVITAIGWLLGGYEEYLHTKKDIYGRWDEENSIISQHGLCQIPAVNIWINQIRDFLKNKGENIFPLWPKGKTFAVALTHDIDNPRYTPFPYVKVFLQSLIRFNFLGIRHSLQKTIGSLIILIQDKFSAPTGFTNLLKAEKKLGVSSTIMISALPNKNTYTQPHDPTYKIEDDYLKASLKLAKSMGFPVGLHASAATAPHVNRYKEQKSYLEKILGNSIKSNRHHYWNISPQNTADALEAMSQVGIEFDTSISFYNRINYRRSIVWPFVPFHPELDRPIKILELPSTCMDNWLGKECPKLILDKHLKQVEETNGLAVLDWHGNRFNNGRYLAEGQVYLDTVRELTKRSDVWMGGLDEIGLWWKERAKKLSFVY